MRPKGHIHNKSNAAQHLKERINGKLGYMPIH
ncbi:hypothetical protein BANRA_05647 [Klebsiella pneumoniae]|nr:hypothetical protein BANRA_05647 [Klebsiella pneumoniae]